MFKKIIPSFVLLSLFWLVFASNQYLWQKQEYLNTYTDFTGNELTTADWVMWVITGASADQTWQDTVNNQIAQEWYIHTDFMSSYVEDDWWMTMWSTQNWWYELDFWDDGWTIQRTIKGGYWSIPAEMSFYDNRTTKVWLQYNWDYCSDLTGNSLINKSCVQWLITGSALHSGNLVTINWNNKIDLWGTATADSILYMDWNSFMVQQPSSMAEFNEDEINFDADNASIQIWWTASMSSSAGSNIARLAIYPTNFLLYTNTPNSSWFRYQYTNWYSYWEWSIPHLWYISGMIQNSSLHSWNLVTIDSNNNINLWWVASDDVAIDWNWMSHIFELYDFDEVNMFSNNNMNIDANYITMWNSNALTMVNNWNTVQRVSNWQEYIMRSNQSNTTYNIDMQNVWDYTATSDNWWDYNLSWFADNIITTEWWTMLDIYDDAFDFMTPTWSWFAGTSNWIIYNWDYTSTNPRRVPTQEYVSWMIQNSSLHSGSAITIDSNNNINLWGTLTDDWQVNWHARDWSFEFTQLDWFQLSQIGYMDLNADYANIKGWDAQMTMSTNKTEFSFPNGWTGTVWYTTDLSGYYTDRSFTDKWYVDREIASNSFYTSDWIITWNRIVDISWFDLSFDWWNLLSTYADKITLHATWLYRSEWFSSLYWDNLDCTWNVVYDAYECDIWQLCSASNCLCNWWSVHNNDICWVANDIDADSYTNIHSDRWVFLSSQRRIWFNAPEWVEISDTASPMNHRRFKINASWNLDVQYLSWATRETSATFTK